MEGFVSQNKDVTILVRPSDKLGGLVLDSTCYVSRCINMSVCHMRINCQLCVGWMVEPDKFTCSISHQVVEATFNQSILGVFIESSQEDMEI